MGSACDLRHSSGVMGQVGTGTSSAGTHGGKTDKEEVYALYWRGIYYSEEEAPTCPRHTKCLREKHANSLYVPPDRYTITSYAECNPHVRTFKGKMRHIGPLGGTIASARFACVLRSIAMMSYKETRLFGALRPLLALLYWF